MLAVTEFLRQGGLYKILTLIVGFQGMPLRWKKRPIYLHTIKSFLQKFTEKILQYPL
jgi:hypothetical protein